MPLPITASRGRRLGWAFLFLGVNLTYFYMAFIQSIVNDAEMRAFKRSLGMPPIEVPLASDFLFILGWSAAYLIIFKFTERRDWYVYAVFVLSGVLSIAAFHSFWWAALVAQGVMMVVMLIGQFYFVHYNDRSPS